MVLLLLCAPAARAQDAAAKELARVQAADIRLRARAVDHSRAARAKARAVEIAEAAARRAQAIPDSAEQRNAAAERAAAGARRELREARGRADGTRKDFVGSARNYLKAEDAYHLATGEYYNEWEYDRVSALLNRPPRKGEELPDFGGDPPPDGPPDSAQPWPDAPPPADPGGGGGAPPVDDAPTLDVVLADALAGNFRPAAPAAARRSAEPATPSESDGPDPNARGGSTGGAPAVELDRGILLSQPSGGAATSAPRRPAASPEDAPRAVLAQAEYALARSPRDAKAWEAKAAALNALRRFDEAEKAAEQAVRLDPGNPKGYRALAWAQLHTGKPDAALANATRMIFLDPENPEGYLLRAFAYEMKGDRTRMMADLERAAALNPKYANHLARARAGLRLFDPNSPDTESMLGQLDPLPAAPANSFLRLGVALVGAAALFCTFLVWRGRRKAPVPIVRDPPSDLVAGRFRKRRSVGRGEFGEVWEALDESLGRSVALEEIAAADAPEARERGLAAARAAGARRAPGAPELYEVVELPAAVILVWSRPPG